MKIFTRNKVVREKYVECSKCKKQITGRTEKVCLSNFNQHYKKCLKGIEQ